LIKERVRKDSKYDFQTKTVQSLTRFRSPNKFKVLNFTSQAETKQSKFLCKFALMSVGVQCVSSIESEIASSSVQERNTLSAQTHILVWTDMIHFVSELLYSFISTKDGFVLWKLLILLFWRLQKKKTESKFIMWIIYIPVTRHPS
jgi:zinc transporter ZupT